MEIDWDRISVLAAEVRDMEEDGFGGETLQAMKDRAKYLIVGELVSEYPDLRQKDRPKTPLYVKVRPEDFEDEEDEGQTEAWHYDEHELSATFDEEDDWRLTSLAVSSPDFLFQGVNLIGLSNEEVIQQIEIMDLGEVSMEEISDDELPDQQVATIVDASLNLWFEDGILTEIQWGDEIIPVDANVGLAFDITTYAVDYTYYPWIKEKWAGGFGLGFRVLDVVTVLVVEEIELDENINASAPVPYINFEYRRRLSDRWRMKAGLGWLDVTLGDVSGSQYIGRLGFEYLTRKRWGFGAAANLSMVDVDWAALSNVVEDEFSGHIDLVINDVSLYIRIRFGS